MAWVRNDPIDWDRLRWDAEISVYCEVDVEVGRRGGMFAFGSAPIVAGVLIARAVGFAIAQQRAQRVAAPRWRRISRTPVTLGEDRLTAHWPGEEAVDVAYRTISSWQATPDGIQIQRVNWAPLHVAVHHPSSFHYWFARLSHGRTWHQPSRIVPTATTPVEGWVQDGYRFAFGLPVGWSQADREWLSWATEGYAPLWALTGVRRLDPAGALNMVVMQTPPDPGDNPTGTELAAWGDELAARFASNFRGRCEGPLGLVNLGGLEGIMFQIHRGVGDPDGPADVQHLLFSRDHALYDVMFIVIPNVADGTLFQRGLPDFHTMLATWRWT
ncbi:MAG: hypothetical protein ACYDEY_04135 [Acidimicrobiales bacterium]